MWRQIAGVAAAALLVGGAAQGATEAAPTNTSPPGISGTAREGETLTASSGTWSGSTPLSFSYHWQRCKANGGSCSSISSADHQTYVLRSGDVGRRLRVAVTASNSDGSASALSGPTGVVDKGLEPKNTALPVISGTAKAGETLSATNGSWANTPTSFDYQWRRCTAAGNDCRDVGPNRSTYQPGVDDVGSTMRVRVGAKNQFGSDHATSKPTGVVAPRGPLPGNTSLPTITGTLRDGQTLAAGTGSWTNNPTRYAYQWLRCDGAGNGCAPIGNGQTQRLSSSDVGHTIRLTVAATNQYGTSQATSAPTGRVAAAVTAGAAIGVEQVSQPNRLIVSGVQFFPRRLTSRTAFIGRFRVSDSRGKLVRGAVVYAIGLPYGWIRAAPEVVTGGDGWATIQFFPTRLMPLHKAALVFFLRARKPGENLLAGVSTRRLVQVGIG
jgi:hypothetical protein